MSPFVLLVFLTLSFGGLPQAKKHSSLSEVTCAREVSRANRELLRRDISKFWGERDHIEKFLTLLGQELSISAHWSNFLDVGAGSYKAAGGDLTLMGTFSKVFPSLSKHIVGFEPFAPAAAGLRAMFTDIPPGTLIEVFVKGCGQLPHDTLEFRGRHNTFTANKRIALHPKYAGNEVITINSTSVDSAALDFGWNHIDVLKTDTEGLEFEVLLGAKHLLQQKRINLVIVAYEDKWTWDSFTAAYPIDAKNHVFKEQIELDTPNLKSTTSWLWHHNYSSYLLGAEDNNKIVTIPLYNDYWDDVFEIGRNPKAYGLLFTWFDFIAVPHGSDLQVWIEKMSTGSTTCIKHK